VSIIVDVRYDVLGVGVRPAPVVAVHFDPCRPFIEDRKEVAARSAAVVYGDQREFAGMPEIDEAK